MTAGGRIHKIIPIGVVMRRVPGITRWAKFSWTAVDVIPAAPDRPWSELRRDGDRIEYLVATLPMTVWAADAEAYKVNLADSIPSVYVVADHSDNDAPVVHEVTASPYEGQDFADSSELEVHKVPMPDGLIAWLRDFTNAHFVPEPFVKRKRDRKRVDLSQDGRGDPRIKQVSDVYRAPRRSAQAQQVDAE